MKALAAFVALLSFLPMLRCHGASVLPEGFENARQPQLAVTAKGRIFLVFGKENAVYVASSTNDGGSFGVPVKVGEVEGLALGMRRGPRIAAADKAVTLVAISHSTGDVYSWTSTDHGATWAPPIQINDVPRSAREGLHALSGNGKGQLFAAWLDLRGGRTELWGTSSADHGKTWRPNIRIYQSPDGTICECCHPSLAYTSTGDIVAYWRNALGGNRDMYRVVSSDDGNTFSDAVKVGSGSWQLNACPMDGGDLAAGKDRVGYVWRRAEKIFFTTDETAEKLISSAGRQPIIVSSPESFLVFWEEGGNLMWQGELAAKPKVLQQKAASASAVWSANNDSVFVSWESTAGKQPSIRFAALSAKSLKD